MAKAKFKMSSGSMKDFFTLHVEKIVLGCVLVLMLLFVWMGSSVETFPANKTPASITQVAGRTTIHINTDTWPKVQESVTPPSIIDPIVISVKPDPWQLGSMDPPIKPSRSKRRDPAIYPPTKLVVDSAIAAVAFLPQEEEVYPLDVKYQELVEEAANAFAPPLMDDLTTKKKAEKKKKKNDREMLEETTPKGVFTGPGGNPRTLGEEERQTVGGYRPSGQSILKTRNIITVKALINVKKQMEEYIDALAGNAANFREDRDTPKYIFFYVERADVTADPNADPKTLKWTLLSTKAATQLYAQRDAEWESLPEEVVDPLHLLPGLTLPVPPVLLTDLKKLAGHPDIPFAADASALSAAELNRRLPEEVPTEGPEGPELPDALLPGGERGPGGSGMGRPTMPIGREGGRGGYASPGGGSGAQFATNKLFRFVDFNVERGHKYRYRVKLTLENPNHPQIIAGAGAQDPSPPPQSLDKEVEANLKVLAQKEAETGRRIFYRDTEWSEASPVISLPDPVTIAGGEVTPARVQQIPTGGKIQMTEPNAKVMAVQWDEVYAANVIGQEDVQLGSVVNFKMGQGDNKDKVAEVLHPVKLEYVPLKDYPFQSNALVVDIRGGEKRDPRSALLSPGEMAVVDMNGNLIIRGEVQDNYYWQRYGIFEPKKLPDPQMLEGGEAGRGLEDVMRPMPRPRGGRER